jgi:hypothetical protein
LDSKGQAVHDLNKFVSCLIAAELTWGSKLINWVLYAILSLLGVYIIMHILPQQVHVDFECKKLAFVGSQTCGRCVIIGLFQNLVYVLAFLFVTSWARRGDTVALKNGNTVDIA